MFTPAEIQQCRRIARADHIKSAGPAQYSNPYRPVENYGDWITPPSPTSVEMPPHYIPRASDASNPFSYLAKGVGGGTLTAGKEFLFGDPSSGSPGLIPSEFNNIFQPSSLNSWQQFRENATNPTVLSSNWANAKTRFNERLSNNPFVNNMAMHMSATGEDDKPTLGGRIWSGAGNLATKLLDTPGQALRHPISTFFGGGDAAPDNTNVPVVGQ